MTIKLKNCVSVGNGQDGVFIGKGVDIEIDGLTTRDNGRMGLNVEGSSYLERLGLPVDTPTELVVDVLYMLHGQQDIKAAKQIVSKSKLSQWLVKCGVDVSTIVANLLTIANSPQMQNF